MLWSVRSSSDSTVYPRKKEAANDDIVYDDGPFEVQLGPTEG